MRKIDEIIIHATSTPAGQEVQARQIDCWHRQRGWAGIGYHFIIHLDGFIEPCRPIELEGAHCYGHNRNSIGVAYIGGKVVENGVKKYIDTRTPDQVKAMHELVTLLIHCYPSIKKVSGHNQYSTKACPCFDAASEFRIYTSVSPLWDILQAEGKERDDYLKKLNAAQEEAKKQQ